MYKDSDISIRNDELRTHLDNYKNRFENHPNSFPENFATTLPG